MRRNGANAREILAGCALLLIASLVGCDTSERYLIWPTAARTGDTVAVLFNTEADTTLVPDGARLDASADNIVIQLSDSTAWTEAVVPRAVIEVPAAKGSEAVAGLGLGSWTGLVAIFDIPDPWPNGGLTFPDAFDVVVEQSGVATMGANELTILGAGGAPLVLSPSTPLTQLEAKPMLRLRPAWDAATAEGFDPGWEIGGVELTLRYSPAGAGDVLALSAVGNGEATSGLVMATELAPQGSDKLWRLMLLHPPGFQLPAQGCNGAGDCFSGRWSLLDLPLDVDESGLANGEAAFETAEFSIEDLVVVDRDGMQLNPAYAGERFFHLYAANHIVPLPEPGLLLLLSSGVLGLAVLDRLERGGRRRTSPRAR
jgi:hypothetical protein